MSDKLKAGFLKKTTTSAVDTWNQHLKMNDCREGTKFS